MVANYRLPLLAFVGGQTNSIGDHQLSLPPCLAPCPQIYSHVAAGFTDGNPYLRELTLKSMAVLGTKLSQKTLNQSLLKHLAKLQASAARAQRQGGRCFGGNRRGVRCSCLSWWIGGFQ